MDKDLYEVLGCDRTATAAELKSAYRKLAKEFHPDRNPGNKDAEARFKEASAAYDILKDEQKRAAYDRYGAAAFQGGGPGGAGAGAGGFDFGDIFDEMFGDFMGRGRGGGHHAREASFRGSDLRYNMQINFEDAYKGMETTLRVPTNAKCGACEGSGAESGTEATTCSTCHGRGKMRMQQGFFTIEQTCSTCRGVGKVIEDPCKTCHGEGRVQKEKSLKVKIPAGVDEGSRIRVAGEGEAGFQGGPAGDLYIFVSIAPHEFFERDGSDLFCSVPLKMTTAILGGEIEVPTVEGTKTKVKIPAGTQTGSQFRLRSKGMSVVGSSARGDMYIETIVEVPVSLSKEQKKLMREFEDSDKSGKTSPKNHSFFAKVRDFLDNLGDSSHSEDQDKK